MEDSISQKSFTGHYAGIHEQFHVSLYYAEIISYQSIQIIDVIRPYWIISHVRSGLVETVTQDQQTLAQAGHIMIHPPDLPFSEIANRSGTHEWMMFSANFAPNLDLFRLYQTALVIPLQSPKAFSVMFRELMQIWHNTKCPFRGIRASAHTLMLIGMVLDSWQLAGSPKRPYELVTYRDRFIIVITYMSQHLHEKINREKLASLLHMNARHLDRVFTESYGITPMQMLRGMRLRKAKQKLESSDDTLAAIAASCGFEDASYLSRVLSKSFGLTPGQYREQARKTMQSYISKE